MKKPLVSVIMPVYNGEKYLKEAISSILNQTYKNFELIIINDCSTDRTLNIIKEFNDKRIKVITNKVNVGACKSRNIGVKSSLGKYIAYMDSDDVSVENRFKYQVDYLEKNKEVVVVGTWAILMNSSGKDVGRQPVLCNDDSLKRALSVSCPFFNGSTMVRKVSLEKIGYSNEKLVWADDYDLWTRLSKVGKLANMKKYLYRYRMHENSLTRRTNEEIRKIVSFEIADRQWGLYGIKGPSPISEWNNIWPGKYETKEEKDYYRLLHLYFAKGYRMRNRLIESVFHVFGAIKIDPYYLPNYAYLAIVLPAELFEKIEYWGLSLLNKRL